MNSKSRTNNKLKEAWTSIGWKFLSNETDANDDFYPDIFLLQKYIWILVAVYVLVHVVLHLN